MKYSEAQYGRIFVMRLEDGDIVHEVIEEFAQKNAIQAAALIVLGGADKDSDLIVGPADGREYPVTPMHYIIDNVTEVAGTGTLFPDKQGKPILHMHMACGRKSQTTTGCIRSGVKVWHIMEVILFELTQTTAMREFDPATGFKLLNP